MSKNNIVGFTLSELESQLSIFGFKPELARELCGALYRKRCKAFNDIKVLPLELRKMLDREFCIATLTPLKKQVSADGTVKYLFSNNNEFPFESAFMPGEKRNTLCISTQSGCRMSCSFCHTGKVGYFGNLSAGEIVNQLISIDYSKDVNRLVLMGMGEPLDNLHEVKKALEIFTADWGFAFGASNITLSTVGMIPELKEIILSKRCNVAISLHSPWPEIRNCLMPIQKVQPLHQILEFLKQNPIKRPLRLSFEYLVIQGVNNSYEDCIEVARLLKDFNTIVNVIPHNSLSDNSSSIKAARVFQQMLIDAGQAATFRNSKGYDIDAACGMMLGRR
jgi:23S rRNA (adenine2503-C2)-methyltransferase